MAGYYGYSMSNNAVYAYENYEMPKSKWNKKKIFEAIEFEFENNNAWFEKPDEVINELKKLPVKLLKKYILEYRGWHHTSKFYNETEFYGINLANLEELTKEDVSKIPLFEKIHEEHLKNELSNNEIERFLNQLNEYELNTIYELEKI